MSQGVGKPGALHQRLRIATAPLHQAAERAFDDDRRFASMGSYVELLDRLWSVHAGLERALTPFGPDLLSLKLELRGRSAFLATDLRAIAGCEPQLDPVAFTYPSTAAALGGLYVIEGSTLGGRVLLHRARERLAVSEHSGGSFLAGYGRSTASNWRGFLQALESLPSAGEAADQAEAGARNTFLLMIDQLSRRA